MLILGDALLSLLAAIGLASLIWFFAAVLLRPRRVPMEDSLAVLIAHGSAEELEQRVRALVRLRREERAFSRIVILDRGLDEEAKARARLLCREAYGVELIEDGKFTR